MHLLALSSLLCSCAHRDPPSLPTRRSSDLIVHKKHLASAIHFIINRIPDHLRIENPDLRMNRLPIGWSGSQRSEEHTSELQSRGHLVCRLLLENQKHPESL